MVDTSSLRFFYSTSFALLLPSLTCLVFPCCKLTCALDTLLPGQFLNENQSLISKNGAFKLGYDCYIPQGYCGLGIWFAKPSSCNREYFPLWQPDAYSYDRASFILSVSDNGVLNYTIYGGDIWSTPVTRTTSISAAAVLLGNGNLVIRDRVNSSMVIWQSFDNPTNVLLPGQHLGFNKINGKKITLCSSLDPYGMGLTFTLSLDATRRRSFIIRQHPNGQMFAGTFPGWMGIHEDGDHMLTFNDVYAYIRLNESGFVTFAKQRECDSILWSAPESLCEFHSYCGPYSLCTLSGSCICPVGFNSLSSNAAWISTGCLRDYPLNCENGEVTCYPIDGIHRYPQKAFTLEVTNMSECESACLRDCTCTAFAYNASCLLWFRELRSTIVLDSDLNGNRLYICRSTKQQSGSRIVPWNGSSKERIVPWKRLVLESMIGVIAVIVMSLILLLRCRQKLLKARTVGGSGSLMVFSFVQIKNSSKQFSEKLGEGGFGCVFKGMLPSCTMVAIKKLKGLRQEDKQFRAEVQTIGMIQHINIVHLLGFCAEGSGRFLVYEYMANGSLSNHLFSENSFKLSWELRYSIALGIARGLAYLHEGCKDCIVHCDIKPDNVLLDAEFCPKIADFGMAKLLGRDYSRVLTTMRGTIGYLAPEWITGVPITHKADVYSYGMVLLEIISGRRNSEKIKEGRYHVPAG
ncbi:G-type lectin S-receptor-like serine/threonine-protein kinase At2g19130 isoform X2 [Sorghum bicolor]|uniref:G-type lectin S-receptor-like serine/threonine-protein kinase At2g19130 isoform X2 n=1 Tax=Sorghum bicolor TaxID=4558 RepID=UPI000B424A16|nr:G-type lectin S-receptor-like serine/threonine-protein kinase At2g19130 isoform X2 [Sorghum bicolor]|eukprot:XP_021311074.1 G-type lectin S-receptor-like serine/threonine-protein kinase At2g19130 isoform X2 [Sorghum bicolor]